jgi:hypothetical protein
MAATGQSKAEKLSRWELLLTNKQPEEGEPLHVTADLTDLAEKLREVRTLESRQDDLRSQARELVTRIRALTREGEKVRGRLGANLRSKYGFESEALMKYGFKPRPLVVRRRTREKLPAAAPAKA